MPRPSNSELRKDLLHAALVLLEARGGTQFSMRELAKEVGYTVTAVYRCYQNREALLVAMQLSLFQQLNAHLLLTQAPSTLEKIEKMGEAFVNWAVQNPTYYRFMFQSGTLLKEADQKIARAGLSYLAVLLRDSPELPTPNNPQATATLLFSSLHGLVSLFLDQRLEESLVFDLRTFYKAHYAPWIQSLLSKD